jgi:S-(hydroxymethyl)mycothiol dehydrogenase
MAGLGAAINTGGVGRGDTVAVIGCGGVGDARDRRAELAGARTIIASTSTTEAGVGQGLRRHPHGRTPRAPIRSRRSRRSPAASAPTCDRGGRPPGDLQQAFYARDLAGTVVLGRRPGPDDGLDLPLIDVFGRGGA